MLCSSVITKRALYYWPGNNSDFMIKHQAITHIDPPV